MLKLLFKQKWYLITILFLVIAEPSLNSVLNFWLRNLYNSASPGAEKVVILRMLAYGFLLWILKRIVSFTSGVVRNRFICNAKQEVKHNLFMSLLGLDTANISNIASSGEYISLFTNDITFLETRFFVQVVSLISGIFSIAILGTSFFALNVKLAAFIIGFGILSMFVPVIFSKKLNEKNLHFSNQMSNFTQRMKEYVVAFSTIKNYAIEREIGKKFNIANRNAEESRFDADYTLSLANNVGQLLSWFMQFIGVGIGLMLVIKGEILIGTVIAAQGFASDLASPLQSIIININSIKSVKEVVKKLESLSSDGSNTSLLPPQSSPSRVDGKQPFEIAFDQFSLTINEKKIIDSFTFRFEEGKKYLIVGLNGSGKSTLFKALKKWYKATSGSIFVGGEEISTIGSDELSKYISYLNENVSLFSGSVRDNISLFRTIEKDNFETAVSGAKINIDLDREVSDEGNNISSGEQRRIEIARSLLKTVKVLIFDEVVSTLDIETAYEIEKMALSFSKKTVIFISHNFSGKLIKHYDEILVLDNGKLMDHGTYEELTSSCEYFRRICEIKFG